MGSPSLRTLIAALDRGCVQLPGLTSSLLRKYPPDTTSTAKGHLDIMARQGVCPTSSQSQHSVLDETTNGLHLTEPTLSPTSGIIIKLVSLPSRTQQNYSDLTGRFPVASHANNSYCLVMYSCDANYIHVGAMQSRNSADYVNAYRRDIGYFKDHGFAMRSGGGRLISIDTMSGQAEVVLRLNS